MIGEIIRGIFYLGIGYGIIGTLGIEGIIWIISYLIGKRRRRKEGTDGE